MIDKNRMVRVSYR